MKLGLLEIAVAAFQILFVRGGYYTQDDELPDGGVTKYLEKETKISCVLKCERDENCDNAMFKLQNKEVRNGECWFVKKNATDTAEDMQKLKKDKAIEGYKKVGRVCEEKKPCKYGRCVDTYDEKGYRCEFKGEWTLLKDNVCFGAKSGEFGTFKIQQDAIMTGMKLVHVGGDGVKCATDTPLTKWGCDYNYVFIVKNIGVFITANREILYPSPKYHIGHGFSHIPGYNANSPYLIFNATNHTVHKGQELQLYYADDFYNSTVHDNEGKSCGDIYAKLIDA